MKRVGRGIAQLLRGSLRILEYCAYCYLFLYIDASGLRFLTLRELRELQRSVAQLAQFSKTARIISVFNVAGTAGDAAQCCAACAISEGCTNYPSF